MKIPKPLFVPASILIVGAACWLFWRSPSAFEKESESDAVASVKTALVEKKSIATVSTAYGSVIAQAGKVEVVSLAFEVRVQHVLVAPGQPVRSGDPLVQITPSPASELTLHQAENTVEEANKELAQTKQRFGLQLATNAEMNQATKAAHDAELQLQSLQREGIGDGNIRAAAEGIVTTVGAQDGQIVPPGGSLVEIVNAESVEVKLGVEPEDCSALTAGQKVVLFPVNQPTAKPVSGSVRLVTQSVNSSTRLVDVYVTLPPRSGLLFNGYVRAEISKSHPNAILVPRAALLPDGSGWKLFTVKDGHALKHVVSPGIITDAEAEIVHSDLNPGDSVVVVGNYELEQGMAVEVSK